MFVCCNDVQLVVVGQSCLLFLRFNIYMSSVHPFNDMVEPTHLEAMTALIRGPVKRLIRPLVWSLNVIYKAPCSVVPRPDSCCAYCVVRQMICLPAWCLGDCEKCIYSFGQSAWVCPFVFLKESWVNLNNLTLVVRFSARSAIFRPRVDRRKRNSLNQIHIPHLAKGPNLTKCW